MNCHHDWNCRVKTIMQSFTATLNSTKQMAIQCCSIVLQSEFKNKEPGNISAYWTLRKLSMSIYCYHESIVLVADAQLIFDNNCRSCLTEADVADAIERRALARSAKDFSKADAVREEMAERGIQIMDTPEGTTWRPRPVLHS